MSKFLALTALALSLALGGAHAATDRQRYEYLIGNLLDHVQDDVTLIGTGGDIQKSEFVRPLLIVATGDFDGIARVTQRNEVHTLDHTAGVHIQTRNDALGQHAAQGFADSLSASA